MCLTRVSAVDVFLRALKTQRIPHAVLCEPSIDVRIDFGDLSRRVDRDSRLLRVTDFRERGHDGSSGRELCNEAGFPFQLRTEAIARSEVEIGRAHV